MKNIADQSFRENQNTHFMFSNIFPKIVPLWDNTEKYCNTGQDTEYGASVLHAGQLRKQTHSQNM